jgi:hypothetical protein
MLNSQTTDVLRLSNDYYPSELSTNHSEDSHACLIKKLKLKEQTKSGKPFVPTYLKEVIY